MNARVKVMSPLGHLRVFKVINAQVRSLIARIIVVFCAKTVDKLEKRFVMPWQ